ncbi:MAG: O-antigen ligase family protein [Bacteroidia bacterium]
MKSVYVFSLAAPFILQAYKSLSYSKTTLLKGLFFTYILSFAFQALIKNCPVQLPEYIFGLLVLYCIAARLNFFPKKLSWADIFLLLFIVVITLDNLFIHSKNSLIQCLIQGYLLCVFFLFRYFFIVWKEAMIALVSKAFICMGILASLCGITGFLLHYVGIETGLMDVYYNFPYSGDRIRALGFTSSPGMLMELIGVAFIFLCNDVLTKKKITVMEIFAFLVLSTVAFITFSKDIVLCFLALAILIGCHSKPAFVIKIAMVFIVLLCIGGYIFFTHYLVLSAKQSSELVVLSRSEYSTGKILYENNNLILVESSYLALKKASITIAKENLLTGIGSGNYADELIKLQQFGQYSPNLFIYDPHSTYFGCLAENGVIVLISLLLMVFAWYCQLFKNVKTFTSFCASPILALLLVCWFNALSCDILNYRHIWVLLGIASGIFSENKVKIKSA